MESRNSSSDNEGEYNDRDFMDHFDLEADKNRIVEHSPKGRFIRFNEELGSGAYKTVYKGYDNETGCEIAWNVIKLPKLPPKQRKRISDEIALLKKLKHPNIISFISAWINKQKEEIVFITEVVTGGSLKKYLKKIKSPRLKVIKSWCREILQGIEYLHELKPHPIIHRDIKCDNIFINSNKGEIRIGDLGLATLMSNAYAASVLGTPEFMAPEMYDEVYGPSVDIYSFGMCLLEMVTNQTPYRECMNPAQVYKKVINGVKPASLGLIANEEVKGFICECLLPRDERPSATNLLNNRFLQSTDQEADNQPVALFETPLENIKEDEHSYTMKTEITMPQHFDEEMGDENDDAEDEKEISTTNVETNDEISESVNQREELKNTELQKRKSSDCVNHNEKKHELFIASAAAGKFKSFDQISTILNNQKIGEKEFVEDKNEAVQEKAELSFQQKQTPLPSARKDQIKYSLQSKGIINGQLVILIKGDMQGHQFEHTAEIRRDKISYEKVISKLQKQLSFLPITNDADFRNQVKTLLESIDYLNISTFMNSGLPPLNSATSIQIKSPSNGNFEFHSNHEKSSNNIFQSQLFLAFYDNYISHLMKDNLWNETEEAMALRQQGELLELQNRHLLQKRTLWDKKHNVLSNSTIAIQSQTIETEDAHHRLNQIYDSHFKHSEARIKEIGQNNFFFSPLSSGPLSPTTSGDNLGSANISVEIMASLLKKLGNTVDDQNRSTSHHPDNFSENIQRSNLASPNNQDILSKAAIEKGGSVFKFPAQLSTGANSHASHQTVPQKNTNELINKLSPKNHTVYSSVTSPKDVPHIIGSPKGYKIVSQDNKVTPMKSVSDKEELHQRRFENPFNSINDQKEEEKTAKIHAKTVDTIQAKKQQDLPNKELIAAEAVDAKKENRYGSLTINTDIANQAEKSQTPSQQTQGPQSVKTRTEEAPKQDAVEVKIPQKTISDTHLDKQDDLGPAIMKKTSSTPKPATTVPPCSNAQPKQSSFRDQASSHHVSNLTAHSSVTRNSPVNATRPEKRYFTQQIVNNGGSTAQALYSPQQSYSTPKGSVGNCQKFCFASGKGQNANLSYQGDISSCGEAKFKGQPTYDLLKKIKGYKMTHTIGKNVAEVNCEDVRVLQSCLDLLAGQEISSTNGQYTPYIESQVKVYQEKAGLAVDGIVTPNLWGKMLSSLEKIEKKWMTKEYMKQKEMDDLVKDREDLKKKLKDKQNKEASESLTKIESKLVDLSSLM